MTLHDVSTQIYSLTGGHVNGEHYSLAQLEKCISIWCRNANGHYIGIVSLADGDWLYELTCGDYGYDYSIPDTREQENRLYDALGLPHNYFCHAS